MDTKIDILYKMIYRISTIPFKVSADIYKNW